MTATEAPGRGNAMNQNSLAALLPSLLIDIEGKPGFWRGNRGEVPVYVLCDEDHNRMRLMAPIGELKEMDPDFLGLLLRSNFDRALDARYALRNEELWSVFVHPLSTLASDDLGLFLDQVVALVKNTGSSYASTELVFGVGEEDDEAAELYQTDSEDDEEEEEEEETR
jgi:hypothetical protein